MRRSSQINGCKEGGAHIDYPAEFHSRAILTNQLTTTNKIKQYELQEPRPQPAYALVRAVNFRQQIWVRLSISIKPIVICMVEARKKSGYINESASVSLTANQ